LVEEARLGDVLELVRRPVVVDAFASYTQIGVRSFGKGIFHYEPTSGADLGKLRYFEIHPGELVISNIKGWEGAVAVSSAADEGCIGSNRFLTYVARDDLVDVNYLRYVLLTERGLELLRRASPGSTDRNLTLGIAAFESLRVRLPDRDVQTKVAARLDRIVALRARTQSQLDLLDGFASSLVDAQLTLIGV
jgi:type I restriction enzyme S subunit